LKKKLNKVDISRAYVYCNDQSKEWTALRLTGITDYEDVIFKYGKITVEENEKDDNASLQFDYDVLVSPNVPKEELEKDMDFKNVMGDILIHILEEQLQKDSMQYVDTDN
jgi:hypothetical protein